MSIAVNLIPSKRLHARQRRRRLRAWCGVTAGYLALLIAACLVTDSVWSRPGQAVTQQLADVEVQVAEINRQLALVQPEIAEAKNQLDASRAVAVQPDWSLLLALLSRLRGDAIVLEKCVLTPEEQAAPIQPVPVAAAGRAPASSSARPRATPKRMSVRLELRGLGRENHDVSQFVLKLEQAGLFDSVRLLETSRAPFGAGHAVAFRVHCLLQETEADK